jgi:hypothetical protein
LTLPKVVKLGGPTGGGVVVGVQAGGGRLVLRENGRVVAEDTVQFGRQNRFVLP